MNRAVKIILILVCVIAVISTVSYCSGPYDTETAHITQIKKTISGTGYILRKETPVMRESTGAFEATVKDGVRVSKESVVGTVISGNLDRELAEKLEDVTQRIERIKNSSSIADIYASDDVRIYSAMHELAASVRRLASEENYAEANEYKNQLESLIEKKSSGGTQDARDELLVSLEEEKYKLEQRIGGIRAEVKAPAAGIFYTTLDGMENLGRESEILDLKCGEIEDFEQILEKSDVDPAAVAKITDSYVWYLAAVIPESDTEGLEVGAEVSVSVDELPYTKAAVLAINPDEIGNAAVVLKSNKNIKGITEKRAVNFEINKKDCTGIYVPIAAVRVVGDVTGVYVMNKNRSATFKCIDILDSEKSYYVVKNKYIPPADCKYPALKVYDNILVNPEAVKKK